MARYKYERKSLRGLSIVPFLNMVDTRNKEIEKADDEWPLAEYPVNRLANELHPHYQVGKIIDIKEYPHAKAYTFTADTEKGTKKLAYFRAGQYISMQLTYLDAVKANKPYCICCGPEDTRKNGTYTFLVKEGHVDGAADFILKNWQVGTSVTMSGPLGNFYYQPLRDGKKVLAIAGGSGITPIYAMAKAITDGTEDFEMTVLYGSRTVSGILLKQELETVAKNSNGKIKIVYVLSDEMSDKHEHGFINDRLIQKYAPEFDSVFVCGPNAMYKHVAQELEQLGVNPLHVHYECSGDYGDPKQDLQYPVDQVHSVYSVKVIIRGEETKINAPAGVSLLQSMENEGIRVPSDCRSGECGWCHSKLIKGDVFVPEKVDGRREADKKFGWIHPCITFPLSDCEIEIFPLPEL